MPNKPEPPEIACAREAVRRATSKTGFLKSFSRLRTRLGLAVAAQEAWAKHESRAVRAARAAKEARKTLKDRLRLRLLPLGNETSREAQGAAEGANRRIQRWDTPRPRWSTAQ